MRFLFDKILLWFNTSVRFDAGERAIFYELIINQLKIGRSLAEIFSSLRNLDVSSEVVYISRFVSAQLNEGKPFSESLASTGFFPAEEIGYLRVADDKLELLEGILIELNKRNKVNVGVFNNVVIPNLYFIVVLGFVVFMISQFEKYSDVLGKVSDLSTNSAYILSVFINDYLWLLGFCLFLVIFGFWYIRNHCYGNIRSFLGVFDRDSRAIYGSQYCYLASIMNKVGASNAEVIKLGKDVFRHSWFMRIGLEELEVLSIKQGKDYGESLGKTILGIHYGELLRAMTADGVRELQGDAFYSLAEIQLVVSKRFYLKLKIYLQLILGVLIMYLMVTLFTGIYSVYL